VAKSQGFAWGLTAFLYFISDVILAIVFEPLMILFVRYAKHSQFLTRVIDAQKKSIGKMTSKYGMNPGPCALIMISFGVDPMTGRSVAHAKGHGFISGWTFAICGDMIFFALIMASTLWLNNILGDGTWTAVIIMLLMIFIPGLIQRLRARGRSQHEP
jgi:hypothetical protein